jgi:hypothetical protein
MTNFTDIATNTDQKKGQIKAILYLLQTSLDEFKKEVDKSYELLRLGEKTDLSKMIEETLNDPFKSIFNVSSKIDKEVKDIVNRITIGYFKSLQKDIKSHLYKNKSQRNDLYYAIVLEKDNIENRSKIFNFFDYYDMLDISERFPVSFQFVPIELIGNFKNLEKILME